MWDNKKPGIRSRENSRREQNAHIARDEDGSHPFPRLLLDPKKTQAGWADQEEVRLPSRRIPLFEARTPLGLQLFVYASMALCPHAVLVLFMHFVYDGQGSIADLLGLLFFYVAPSSFVGYGLSWQLGIYLTTDPIVNIKSRFNLPLLFARAYLAYTGIAIVLAMVPLFG